MNKAFLAFVCIIFCGCSSYQREDELSSIARMEGLRIALADLEQEVKRESVELEIVKEKMAQSASLVPKVESQKEDKEIRRHYELLQVEFRTFAQETHRTLAQLKVAIESCQQKLQEQQKVIAQVGDLKGTLTDISTLLAADVASVTTTYVVKPGDSLEKIARQAGMSVEEIKKHNRLSSDTIFVGQKLLLKSAAKG